MKERPEGKFGSGIESVVRVFDDSNLGFRCGSTNVAILVWLYKVKPRQGARRSTGADVKRRNTNR